MNRVSKRQLEKMRDDIGLLLIAFSHFDQHFSKQMEILTKRINRIMQEKTKW
jgi:hypothetical protein